jgi:hypothetical protein
LGQRKAATLSDGAAFPQEKAALHCAEDATGIGEPP